MTLMRPIPAATARELEAPPCPTSATEDLAIDGFGLAKKAHDYEAFHDYLTNAQPPSGADEPSAVHAIDTASFEAEKYRGWEGLSAAKNRSNEMPDTASRTAAEMRRSSMDGNTASAS